MGVRYQSILVLFSILFVSSGVYMLSRTTSVQDGVPVENTRRDWTWDDRSTHLAVQVGNMFKCSDPPCMERLSKSDLRQYYKCIERMQSLAGTAMPKEKGCVFASDNSHLPVALISFPGSGNTWVRQLLEATTGICTGSTMCDMSLRFAGFTGESINSGSVLVVKTHTSVHNWNISAPHFQSAIVIIRNPLDALVSEWSRRVANDFKIETVHLNAHTKEIGSIYFGTNKKWNSFIRYQVKRWQEIVHHWLIGGRKAGKEVLVVHYEELKYNRDTQLKRMLNFLGLNSSKALDQDFGMFHRVHKKEFEPYTKKQKQYVLTVIKNTMRELEQNHMKSEANLTEYIHDLVS